MARSLLVTVTMFSVPGGHRTGGWCVGFLRPVLDRGSPWLWLFFPPCSDSLRYPLSHRPSDCPGCRSARRPAGGAVCRLWHGRWLRAVAGRPTARRENGGSVRTDWPGRPHDRDELPFFHFHIDVAQTHRLDAVGPVLFVDIFQANYLWTPF